MFPLANVVVFPCEYLPLNIFGASIYKYGAWWDGKNYLIGMNQPRDDNAKPEFFEVGCAACITRYEETKDGQLEIMLSGLCRFRVEEEITTSR